MRHAGAITERSLATSVALSTVCSALIPAARLATPGPVSQ
jgi:hypothetical protein